MAIVRIMALTMLACLCATSVHADPTLWKKLYEPDHFAIMRHAEAPGTGDPENFNVDDCTTQRNLSISGREQAKIIGDHIRANGIKDAMVYTSQWCRCVDTAELMEIGLVQKLPALNSFYQRYQNKEKNLAVLRQFLSDSRDNASPIMLVTHQVTISALTDQYTRQGEIVIFKHLGGDTLEIIGSIAPR